MGNCISRTSRSQSHSQANSVKGQQAGTDASVVDSPQSVSPTPASSPLLSWLTEIPRGKGKTAEARTGIHHKPAIVPPTGSDLLSPLPHEVKLQIVKKLHKSADLSALLALAATSMVWKRFLFEKPFEYGFLREAHSAIRDVGDLQAIGGKWLPFLTPKERTKFIDEAIENYRNGHGAYLGMLGHHMALLTTDELDRVIEVVTNAPGGLDGNLARSALISVMADLTLKQREAIFDHVIKGISEPLSIRALAEQMEHLSPNQRNQLFDAAYNGNLEPDEIPDPAKMRNRLCALEPGAKYLSKAQCTKVIAALFNEELDVNARCADANRGASFAARMTHSTETQRERIVSICIRRATEGDPGAIANLGPGAGGFSEEQRTRLLDSAEGVRDSRLKITTMTSFSKALPDWNPKQREVIFEAIFGKPGDPVDDTPLDDVTLRGLIAVAAQAGYLNDEQQKHLVLIAVKKGVKQPAALRAVWPHVAQFSDGNHKPVTDATNAIESWGEEELRGVAPVVKDLKDATRSKIVSAIENLSEERRAVIVPTFRPAMAQFSVKQRQRILAAASAGEHRWWRASALGGLVIEAPSDRFAKHLIAALGAGPAITEPD